MWDSTLRKLGFECIVLIAVTYQIITTIAFLIECEPDQAHALFRQIAKTCQRVRVEVESRHPTHTDEYTEVRSTEAYQAVYRVDAIYLRQGKRSPFGSESTRKVTALDGTEYSTSSKTIYFHHVHHVFKRDIRLCSICRIQLLYPPAPPPSSLRSVPTSSARPRRKPPSTSVVRDRISPGFPAQLAPEPQSTSTAFTNFSIDLDF